MTGIAASIFLGALVGIAAIAMTVFLGVWVYRDAEKKGMNGILWTAVVILVPSYIGIIVYLIVRMDNQKAVCSECNATVDGRNKYCSNCGAVLVPAVESPEQEEAFRKSQRNVLIGIFSSLAAIVIFAIFMVAFLITGTMRMVGNTLDWVSRLDSVEWADTLEDALGDIDVLFDEDEIHVYVDKDEVVLSDKDGNQLFRLDGEEQTVDVDLEGIRDLLDKYHIEYNENVSEKEIEREVREAIRDALKDYDED